MANPACDGINKKEIKANIITEKIISNVLFLPNLSDTVPHTTRPAQLLSEYKLT